eukprot:jgi/Mesen1/3810/ME000206S02991
MDEEHQTGEEYLLQRWPSILQLEDVDYEKYCAAKEEWFGEAFTFLRGLPPGEHVCCHHRAVMSLLLEPFYHYYSQTGEQKGQLAELWRHISSDFSGCTACIMTYHRAVEQLQHEYTPEALAPLLETLARLDEERVVELLKRIRLKIAGNEYNRNKEADNTQLACALFEVLSFCSLSPALSPALAPASSSALLLFCALTASCLGPPPLSFLVASSLSCLRPSSLACLGPLPRFCLGPPPLPPLLSPCARPSSLPSSLSVTTPFLTSLHSLAPLSP